MRTKFKKIKIKIKIKWMKQEKNSNLIICYKKSF